jgi:hypothetical protein
VPVAGDSAIGTNRVVLTGPAQCRRYQPAQTVDAALVYTCCHLSGPERSVPVAVGTRLSRLPYRLFHNYGVQYN